MNTSFFFGFATIVFFTSLLVSSQDLSYDGIAQQSVTFSGSSPNCPDVTCNVTQHVSQLSCYDSSTWNSGERNFTNPLPSGTLAIGINVTLQLTIGCNSFTLQDPVVVSIDGTIVELIPEMEETPDCSCTQCMKSYSLSSIQQSDGWPKYNYAPNGENTIKIWSSKFICASTAVIDIGYIDAPSPKVTNYYPKGVPLNTEVKITLIGTNFMESQVLYCTFDGVPSQASYLSSTTLSCTAPVESTAKSVSFEVIDADSTIYGSGEFLYYVDPVISSISPTSGPSTGRNVTLYGSNFFNSSSAVCKFGNVPVLHVDFINSSCVICVDAADVSSDPREVTVEFSENFNNYVLSPVDYTFTGISTLPTITPVVSSTPTRSPSISNLSSASVVSSTVVSVSNESTGGPIPPFAWGAIGIAIIIILVLFLGSCLVVYQNSRKKKEENSAIYSGGLERRISSSRDLIDPNTIPFSEIKNMKQIEKGSFGVIFAATWRGTKIAVKQLPATMTEKQMEEFFQEAALMRSLRHPNILQYLGISHSEHDVCICMEFMPLGSLYRILHQSTSDFNRSKIRSICLDTVRGMNYLHQQQPPIVHRDLKSHNLLVDSHWRVKVCDFGLSRITAQNQTMTACGTPSWTAPEVLRNERYTTKADVYGFGVVVWEMFSRADPFPGMPPFQIVFAVGTQKLRPTIQPDWPSEWVDLMTTCWNEDAQARPTFEDVIDILENMNDP